MGYPMGIDDFMGSTLEAELESRKQKRDKGLCDYCGRKSETESCRYPDRHNAAPVGIPSICLKPGCDVIVSGKPVYCPTHSKSGVSVSPTLFQADPLAAKRALQFAKMLRMERMSREELYQTIRNLENELERKEKQLKVEAARDAKEINRLQTKASKEIVEHSKALDKYNELVKKLQKVLDDTGCTF